MAIKNILVGVPILSKKIGTIDDFLGYYNVRHAIIKINNRQPSQLEIMSDPSNPDRKVVITKESVGFYGKIGGGWKRYNSDPIREIPAHVDEERYFKASENIIEELASLYTIENGTINVSYDNPWTDVEGKYAMFILQENGDNDHIVLACYDGGIFTSNQPLRDLSGWEYHNRNKNLYIAGSSIIMPIPLLERKLEENKEGFEREIYESEKEILRFIQQ